MSAIELKDQIADYMSQTDDEIFLGVIYQMIRYHQASQVEVEPMTTAQLNQRIDEGLADKKAGRVFSTDEVRAYFANKQA